MTPPNFFVIGMPRAGTTTLWNLLSAHPDVFMTSIKEPRHFDEDIAPDPYASFRRAPLPETERSVIRDRDAYLSLFNDADGHHAVGEASLYIRSSVAAQRIHEFNPRAKFILLLRDPVDALYSFYHMHLRNASIRCTFDEFFAEYSPWYRRVPDHLRQILELFGPDSVSIHMFPDLERDAGQVYRSVLHFLGVDVNASPEFRKYNSSLESAPPGIAQELLSVIHAPFATRLRKRFFAQELGISEALARLLSRPRAELGSPTKRRYSAEFKAAIQDLATMTGRDFSGWY